MNRVIIVAAGKGARMQGNQRKQFLQLSGRPILLHTLCAFSACETIGQIIVVIPADLSSYCHEQIVAPAGLQNTVVLITGGRQRQDSVYKGLESIVDDEGIVLIHDGVRPFVTPEMIAACIQGAQEWGSCIPVTLPVDTPKQVNDQGVITGTIARGTLRMAQTPQAFQLPIIREAHRTARQKSWTATDDASLVERMGLKVHTIEGDPKNLKITTAQDLALAEFYHSKSISHADGG